MTKIMGIGTTNIYRSSFRGNETAVAQTNVKANKLQESDKFKKEKAKVYEYAFGIIGITVAALCIIIQQKQIKNVKSELARIKNQLKT